MPAILEIATKMTDAILSKRSNAALASREFGDLPGPRGFPIFGNLLQVKAPIFHLQLEDWYRKYGGMYKLKFGRRKYVVVGDHNVIADVLRDRPDGFDRPTRQFDVWTGMGMPPGLLVENDKAWERQRRMVMAGFDPTHVRQYFPSLQDVALRLRGRWINAVNRNESIDLRADLMRYTVDTIAGLAFGVEVRTLESDNDVIQRHLEKIFPELYRRLLAIVPTWRLFKTASDRKLDESIGEVMNAVAGFIAQAKVRVQNRSEPCNGPDNLLESMIIAASHDGAEIDDLQIAGNVLTMLLAGEDTTANSIAWMIYLLWSNPKALRSAIEEIRNVCQRGTIPTLEQIDELKFVEACAYETMRLKPVAAIIMNLAKRDTVVDNVKIKAGTHVICLSRHDGVDDAMVVDAAQFLPERWLLDGDPGKRASSFKRITMPFGAGPRICPGRFLALLEMKMAIATLFGTFNIEEVSTPDKKEPQEYMSFSMRPVGLEMRLTRLSGDGESNFV